MLRNLRNGTADFYKNRVKSCARLERKKSQKRGAREKISTKLSREMSRGGFHPPPPGLIRVNTHSP